MVPLRDEEQLDGEVEKFLVDIQQSAWENNPEIKRRTNGNNYPKGIRDLIAEKRKAGRRWQQTRDPQDKTELNNLAQQLKIEIKELNNDSINAYLRELTIDNNTDYSLWKATKIINRPIMQIAPIRKTDGTWARNNGQKAQRFAERLAHILYTPSHPLSRSAYPLQPHTGPTSYWLPLPTSPSNPTYPTGIYTLYIMSLIFFIYLPMKMEPIRISETSAIKTQTPGNYPKRKILRYTEVNVS
jgi:hypothetical protein